MPWEGREGLHGCGRKRGILLCRSARGERRERRKCSYCSAFDSLGNASGLKRNSEPAGLTQVNQIIVLRPDVSGHRPEASLIDGEHHHGG